MSEYSLTAVWKKQYSIQTGQTSLTSQTVLSHGAETKEIYSKFILKGSVFIFNNPTSFETGSCKTH